MLTDGWLKLATALLKFGFYRVGVVQEGCWIIIGSVGFYW